MEPDEKSSRHIMSLGYLISKRIEEISQSKSLKEYSQQQSKIQEEMNKKQLEERLKETE